MFSIAPDDYTAFTQTITLDHVTTSALIMIEVNDDMECENDEGFEIMLTSRNDGCTITRTPVPVNILDNESM